MRITGTFLKQGGVTFNDVSRRTHTSSGLVCLPSVVLDLCIHLTCVEQPKSKDKMSSQKGNVSRSRGQKHQNAVAFKNDKYGATAQVKVCEPYASLLATYGSLVLN